MLLRVYNLTSPNPSYAHIHLHNRTLPRRRRRHGILKLVAKQFGLRRECVEVVRGIRHGREYFHDAVESDAVLEVAVPLADAVLDVVAGCAAVARSAATLT